MRATLVSVNSLQRPNVDGVPYTPKGATATGCTIGPPSGAISAYGLMGRTSAVVCAHANADPCTAGFGAAAWRRRAGAAPAAPAAPSASVGIGPAARVPARPPGRTAGAAPELPSRNWSTRVASAAARRRPPAPVPLAPLVREPELSREPALPLLEAPSCWPAASSSEAAAAAGGPEAPLGPPLGSLSIIEMRREPSGCFFCGLGVHVNKVLEVR